MERHLDLCLDAGINIEGTNAEVAPGQWEYQTFAKEAKQEMKCGRTLHPGAFGRRVWLINRLSKAIGAIDQWV